jgi:hypothetical protein
MRAARRIAMVAGFVAWLFCWSLLRDVRARFDGGVYGSAPPWLIGLLGVALILTIGAAVTAAIRLPVWPWCAGAGAIFVVAGALGAHFAKLHAAEAAHALIDHRLVRSQSLGAVLHDVAHTGGLHVFLVVVPPAILLAVGIYGWLRGPRDFFAMEDPSAA